MSRVPGCQPDGPKIRQLIWDRGVNVHQFARSINRNYRTIWGICSKGDRASVEAMRQIARGLSTPARPVRVRDISDWTGDDDIESGAETKIPA